MWLFSSSTLFIQYINIQDTNLQILWQVSFITMYTLCLCTAKMHVLYCSWCSVYLYNWYEATCNTKVHGSSTHWGLPKHTQYNGTCGHTHGTQKFLPFEEWNPSYPDHCLAPSKLRHYVHLYQLSRPLSGTLQTEALYPPVPQKHTTMHTLSWPV